MRLRLWFHNIFHRLAFDLARPAYMLGYEAGYSQGHFDGWAAHAYRDEREEIVSGAFIDDPDEAACRVCGCTQNRACVDGRGPCWWVDHDLCSHCAEPAGKAVA